jgi:hypothetical protein
VDHKNLLTALDKLDRIVKLQGITEIAMQRLNIPLHRHTKTTRRSPRRVVWLFTVSALIFCCLTIIISSILWFQRNTVFIAAPDDTAFALHFTPTKRTWPLVREQLKQFPLVSNRPLSIEDISSFVQGEFALFSTESGEFSLAVRSSKALIPTELLDSYGISYQEVSSNVFLLSSTLTSVGGWVEENNHNYTLPSFSHKTIGELHILLSEEEAISGPIKCNGQETKVYLPKIGLSTHNLESVPASTIAVLSTPFWTNDPQMSLSTSIQHLFSAYEVGLYDEFINSFSNNPGIIILEKTDTLSYLYHSTFPFNEAQLEKLLKLSVALQSPQISYWTLPDGTRIHEVIADPSTIIVEQIPIAGSLINHIPLDTDADIYYANTDKGGFVTNSENLLQNHLNETPLEDSMNVSNALYVDLSAFASIYKNGETQRNWNAFSLLSAQISNVSIEENRYSTIITLQ